LGYVDWDANNDYEFTDLGRKYVYSFNLSEIPF